MITTTRLDHLTPGDVVVIGKAHDGVAVDIAARAHASGKRVMMVAESLRTVQDWLVYSEVSRAREAAGLGEFRFVDWYVDVDRDRDAAAAKAVSEKYGKLSVIEGYMLDQDKLCQILRGLRGSFDLFVIHHLDDVDYDPDTRGQKAGGLGHLLQALRETSREVGVPVVAAGWNVDAS